MHLVRLNNGNYAVRQIDNKLVVMINNTTRWRFTEVESAKDILALDYKCASDTIIPDKDILKKWELGGRRWSSIKYAVAKAMNIDKAQLYKLIKDLRRI